MKVSSSLDLMIKVKLKIWIRYRVYSRKDQKFGATRIFQRLMEEFWRANYAIKTHNHNHIMQQTSKLLLQYFLIPIYQPKRCPHNPLCPPHVKPKPCNHPLIIPRNPGWACNHISWQFPLRPSLKPSSRAAALQANKQAPAKRSTRQRNEYPKPGVTSPKMQTLNTIQGPFFCIFYAHATICRNPFWDLVVERKERKLL